MIDKYWAMYEQIVLEKYYYWHYKIRSERISRLIKGFIAICTCGGIAAWFTFSQWQIVWAIVIGLSQVIGAIDYLFPYTRQINTINFYLPDLNLLINRIDHVWDRVNSAVEISLTNDEISNKILEFSNEQIILEAKFIGDTYFPRNKEVAKKAEKDRNKYMNQRYYREFTDGNTIKEGNSYE
ncbi:MAG: hypothetical protein FWD38_08060 [Oscillospiraceae bacterium]|nr:hypothetical protein [Oscillospiraceae bacterium]